MSDTPVQTLLEHGELISEKRDGKLWTYLVKLDGTRRQVCGAKARNGNVCLQPVIKGNNRCRFHGGKSPRGIASARFQSGRYSRYLPEGLLEKYQQALADPDLLALTDEIAVLQANASKLMEQLDKGGDTFGLWKQLQQTQAELQNARAAGDAVKMAYWLTEQDSLIRQGVSQAARLRDLWDVFERIRRMSESEQKRRVALRDYMTSEQVMVFVAAVTDLIKQHVDDKNTLRQLSTGLTQLIAAKSGEGAES